MNTLSGSSQVVCGRRIYASGHIHYSRKEHLKFVQGPISTRGAPLDVDRLQRGKPIWDRQEERDYWEGKEVHGTSGSEGGGWCNRLRLVRKAIKRWNYLKGQGNV